MQVYETTNTCTCLCIWVQLPFSSGQDGEDWSKWRPLIARRTCMEPAPILGISSLGLDGTNSRFLHFSYKTRGAYSYLYTNTILACKYSFSYKISHFDNITSCTDFQVCLQKSKEISIKILELFSCGKNKHTSQCVWDK